MNRAIGIILWAWRRAVVAVCGVVVLFAATMWIRGMSVGDRLLWARSKPGGSGFVAWDFNIWSARGGVGVFINIVDYNPGPLPDSGPTWDRKSMVVYPYVPVPQAQQGRHWQGLGFAWFAQDPQAAETYYMSLQGLNMKRWERVFIFPWGAVMVVFGTPMAWMVRGWARRRRVKRRRSAGQCIGCGYDLRHSPSYCPECGAGRGSAV